MQPLKRRSFLKGSLATGGLFSLTSAAIVPVVTSPGPSRFREAPPPPRSPPGLPDLQPARWIWYPSERCLPNTFALFRREVHLPERPRTARGWISADSRYRLEVNGQRVQWGPAPCDPRWLEADPVDLTDLLQAGLNVLGATVLYYGQGDGTWPIGKPGFLFRIEIEHADGRKEIVASDRSWQALLARSWPAGHYKRWYLRALQEEFDARLHPHGWSVPGFTTNPDWRPAMELGGSPNLPAICTDYSEYMLDLSNRPPGAELRPRRIPLLHENLVPVGKLQHSCRLEWQRTPREYFECRTPDAFTVVPEPCARATADGNWEIALDAHRGALLTFEFTEQIVGWPQFTLEAPEGTTVELLVHEAHDPAGPVLLNTHFDSWTRFICRAGENRFETFDFESLRWLQLHLHGAAGTVRLRNVGVRRRQFPWPQTPHLRCADPALQRLFDASLNTLHNCAQETLVDGMARERQQYSGDCGHQLHAIYPAFGETRLPARYLATFSQGLTLDGFFLDCWPAYDRLARLIERQLHLSGWGPILDHGIGFNFDCYYHLLYTGDLEALREPYPRLLRFARYLEDRLLPDGLLPVDKLGVPSVWIDHVAYQQQRHKQCAFNLYGAAMFRHALAPLARAFGDTFNARAAERLGRAIQNNTVRAFWDRTRSLFVNNLPWLDQEKTPRLCDRSLATALLFGQCPGNRTDAALRALTECPRELGFSYPANAGWRLWALAVHGHTDVVLHDLRTRWATMPSVLLNNTLQEDWQARPDTGQQWSHCAVVPLYLAFLGLAGIRPVEPGFRRVEIRPQPADLNELDLTAHTVLGPLQFHSTGPHGRRRLRLTVPSGCDAVLQLPRQETVDLPPAPASKNRLLANYRLPQGETVTLHLRQV